MIGVRLLGLVRPEDWVMLSCNISMQRLVQAKADETNFVAFTMGMSFLGHNELEISPTAEKPEVIQEFLYTVASYTLKTGKGLRDGQILGLHPEKAQAVRYAESSMIPGLKTMQITL